MSYGYRLNQLIVNGTVKRVFPLPKNPLYCKGEVYWCSYWQKYYTVLDASYVPVLDQHEKVFFRLKEVKVKWEDGKIGTHCTKLDARDYRLILGDKNENI